MEGYKEDSYNSSVNVYVDDILGIGDCKTVEKVIRNSRRLEEDNKFRFSRKKSKYNGYKKWKGKN